LHDIGEWIEHLSWISYMSMTGWLFSTVSVIHYFSFFITVGGAVLVDLRVLGLAAKSKPLTKVADQICPWMWIAFWFAILSGSLEAATDAGDYLPNFWYELKIFTVIISAVVVYIVQKQIPKWAEKPAIPAGAKVLAIVSGLLWLGSILAGVELPAITGLG
jgi:hypothetical protein